MLSMKKWSCKKDPYFDDAPWCLFKNCVNKTKIVSRFSKIKTKSEFSFFFWYKCDQTPRSIIQVRILAKGTIPLIYKYSCREWIFGEFYCTVNNFIAYMSVAVSVFSLVAIAMDRLVILSNFVFLTRLRLLSLLKAAQGIIEKLH